MPINLPSYFESPDFRRSQDILSPVGEQLLTGDIPEFLSPISQAGSPEFEKMLALLTRDVKTGVTEDLARRGTRGARGADITGRAVGDVSTKLRYQDLLRSLKGREFLFGQGRGITEGVRGAGLTEGGQRNVFGLQSAQLQYQSDEDERRREQEEENAWMDLLSTGIGAAGNIAGMAFLGGFPLGSAAQAVTGGITSGGSLDLNRATGGFDDLLGGLNF